MNRIKISEDIQASEFSIVIPFRNTEYKFTGKTFIDAAKVANQFARARGVGVLRKLEEAIAEYISVKRRSCYKRGGGEYLYS